MTFDFDNKENTLTHTYLKYKGPYNWRELLRFIKKWYDTNHYAFFEKKYKEKPGQYGTEIGWTIEGEKKIDGYMKYFIKVEFRAWDNVPIELIKDGRKVMMDEARIRMAFNSSFKWDYEKQFEGRTIFKKMQDFLINNIYGEETWAIHWDGLYYEMNRFKNEVEAHLKMETATEGSPYHG